MTPLVAALVLVNLVGLHEAQVEVPGALLGFTEEETQSILNEIYRTSKDHPLEETKDHLHGTPLTNFYLRLHRHLFATGHLPANWGWGRVAEGQQHVNPDMELSDMVELSRVSVNKFWLQYQHHIPAGSRCLEQPPLYYITRTENCSETWTLLYEGDRSKWRVDDKDRYIYTDMAQPDAGSVLPDYFDAIVSTQAMQYFEPSEAADAFHTMLRRHGLLYLTVPFHEKQAPEWPDWYRFTPLSIKRNLEHYGFRERVTLLAGDSMLTTAFLLGFSATDFGRSEVEQGALYPVDQGATGVYYAVLCLYEVKTKRHVEENGVVDSDEANTLHGKNKKHLLHKHSHH